MRLLITLVSILLTTVVYGQQLKFRGLPVDTIFINGTSGHYHFDNKGTTTGQNDVYIIAFDKIANNYIVANHLKINFKSTYKPATTKRAIKHLNKDRGKVISHPKVDSLLAAFSTNYSKLTFESIGIDKQEFLSLTGEKHIRKVAKIYKEDWHFKMRYTTKERNDILFKGCQNIDTFNLYVATIFDTCGYIVVTDFWDEMHVHIKTASKEFGFEGKYPNVFKQPWYDHSDSSKDFAGSIVNLKINSSLVAILPEKFYRRNTIELQSLMYNYIKWYLHRRKIIYSNY